MTSHVEYLADQSADQLSHLIEVATKKRDDLMLGGWVWVWVVADFANQGWFSDEDYAGAVDFMIRLAQKHVASGKRCELSIERNQYRPSEAKRFTDETKAELRASAESQEAGQAMPRVSS